MCCVVCTVTCIWTKTSDFIKRALSYTLQSGTSNALQFPSNLSALHIEARSQCLWQIYSKYIGCLWQVFQIYTCLWQIYSKYIRHLWHVCSKYIGCLCQVYSKYIRNLWQIYCKYICCLWQIYSKFCIIERNNDSDISAKKAFIREQMLTCIWNGKYSNEDVVSKVKWCNHM